MRKRHRWVKLRIHVYICRDCGTAYENKQGPGVGWYRVYYKSNGTNSIEQHVPACEPGVRGARALQKYESALAGAAR